MSLYTEIAKLNPNNPQHTKLVEDLARAKAKHDFTRQQKHRKDPEVLQTLLDYRKLRNELRLEGEKVLQNDQI